MLRSDLWVAAFLRRHNMIGHICVVERRGDAVAGQIFISIDHLDGTASLLVPAPAAGLEREEADRLFTKRFEHAAPAEVAQRIAREVDFDPDLWVIALEMRRGDTGVVLV